MKIAGIVIAIIAILLLVFSIIFITAFEQPVTCSICHDENVIYKSWQQTKMAEEGVKCLDCHADPGFLGHLKAHLHGTTYLFATKKAYNVVIPAYRCLRCHEGGGGDSENSISANHFSLEMKAGKTCADCHRQALHIRIRN